jgi:hypothetical protein
MRWCTQGAPSARLPSFPVSCCSAHNESTTVFMPGCIDDVKNVINIGAQDGQCDLVCV